MLKENYYTEPTEIDNLVFEKLIPADHFLRLVKAAIALDSFREQVKDCYSDSMGRGAEDPVRLIKLEFLQFHYNLSDREVIAQAQVNVAFRFFLDLSLDSPLPVPSLLSQFRSRLGHQLHQRLFDFIIGQARERGLVKDNLRLKDATHIIANIAIPTTIALVAQVRDRLIKSARAYRDTAEHEQKATRIRETTRGLKDEERLLHRVTHLQEIVEWAEKLQTELGSAKQGDKTRERFDQSLKLAHKVLADRDSQSDHLRSLVDEEARRNKHGEYYDGYLLDICMDAESELITALDLMESNGDEAANAEELIKREEEAHQNEIEELSIDSIGFRGDVLRKLEDEEGLDLRVYVPPFEQPRKSERFKPEDFELEEKGEELSCPGGKKTSKYSKKKHGRQFYFSARDCKQCEVAEQCISAEAKTKYRVVFKSDYQKEYTRARERANTKRYQEVRQEQKKVERKIADIMNNHAGRRARYWGKCRVKIQYLMIGIVVNIKRMMKLIITESVEVVEQMP